MIFEDTKLPLRKWLEAISLENSNKKGITITSSKTRWSDTSGLIRRRSNRPWKNLPSYSPSH